MLSTGSILIVILIASNAAAQSPTFEVASVKATGPLDPQKLLSGRQRVGTRIDAARVDIENETLIDLIETAFDIKPYQVNGPGWLRTGNTLSAERFDIHATLPAGTSTDQVPQMLQMLLADRFKLTFHRETKDQPVFALVVGKDGPKMQPSDEQETPSIDAQPAPVQVSGNAQTGLTVRGGRGGTTRVTMGQDGVMRLEAERVTMPQLADSITGFVGRPVIDMTGLAAAYKIALTVTKEDLMAATRASGLAGPPALDAAPVPADPGGISIFQSVQQLGLRLELRKAPIEHLVIDHLEKLPTEN